MIWFNDAASSIGSAFNSAWSGLESLKRPFYLGEALFPESPPRDVTDEIRRAAEEAAPVIWLLGKAQAGKTSIVRTITKSTEAEVGQGYKACTTRSRIYDFPSEAPVIRFLDTRGIGEVGYDPSDDIVYCESSSHLVMAVMKVTDPDQDDMANILLEVRKRHPEWPIVVVQTSLHDLYRPGEGHQEPYPFRPDEAALPNVPLKADLRKCLQHQRSAPGIAELGKSGPVWWVPVDLTDPDDGYPPSDYGRAALMEAISQAAPEALKQVLQGVERTVGDQLSRRAHDHVLGYAMAAGAADVLPGLGFAMVPAIQAKMIHSLASIYGWVWTREYWHEFFAVLGAGAVIRYIGGFLVRETVKLVPIWGQTAGAITAALYSFATTYALGVAADAYLRKLTLGEAINPDVIRERFETALSEGADIFRESDIYKRLALLTQKRG